MTRGEIGALGDKAFGNPRDDEQRQQVREHLCRRTGEGAHPRGVAQERHVKRNVAQVEVQESLDEPSPVEAAHTKQRRPSSLRGLTQRLRALLSSTRRVGFQAPSLILYRTTTVGSLSPQAPFLARSLRVPWRRISPSG